jgi:hypothetical protein
MLVLVLVVVDVLVVIPVTGRVDWVPLNTATPPLPGPLPEPVVTTPLLVDEVEVELEVEVAE